MSGGGTPAVFGDATERDHISAYRDLDGHDTVR
jgi:hypothetical protein